MMKKLIFIAALIQGVVFSVTFGSWAMQDHIALIKAVNVKAEHAEMRHRINVGFEGVWYLLSNMIVLYSVKGLSSSNRKEN